MWDDYQNLVLQIKDLRREAQTTYDRVVLPLIATDGFAQTLYGYMHRAFAFVDALSSYWKGTNAGDQTKRMTDFMEKYVGPNRRAHRTAVKIWRHTLAHTALPRNFQDVATGRVMHYMIQWHSSDMRHQPHYTFSSIPRGEILNLSCLSFIQDVEAAAERFVKDLEASPALHAKASRFAAKLGQDSFKST